MYIIQIKWINSGYLIGLKLIRLVIKFNFGLVGKQCVTLYLTQRYYVNTYSPFILINILLQFVG